MSRLFGFGIVCLDAATTIASVLCNSVTLLTLVVAVFTSILIGFLSRMIQTMLWPTYFWDDSVVPIKIEDVSDAQDNSTL